MSILLRLGQGRHSSPTGHSHAKELPFKKKQRSGRAQTRQKHRLTSPQILKWVNLTLKISIGTIYSIYKLRVGFSNIRQIPIYKTGKSRRKAIEKNIVFLRHNKTSILSGDRKGRAGPPPPYSIYQPPVSRIATLNLSLYRVISNHVTRVTMPKKRSKIRLILRKPLYKDLQRQLNITTLFHRQKRQPCPRL